MSLWERIEMVATTTREYSLTGEVSLYVWPPVFLFEFICSAHVKYKPIYLFGPIQFIQTGGQLDSDTSPVSEYSLLQL